MVRDCTEVAQRLCGKIVENLHGALEVQITIHSTMSKVSASSSVNHLTDW